MIGSLKPCFGTVICVREGCQNRRNSGSGWTLNRPKSDLTSSKIQGDAKESEEEEEEEEEVKNTGEESAKEAKEEGKNTGEEGAQEAKEDVPNTGEERAHLTGEELQETEEEARLTRKAFLMSLHFAWFPGVTQTHRHPCWVHRETNEVVLQKPTDDQLEKRFLKQKLAKKVVDFFDQGGNYKRKALLLAWRVS